MAALQNELAFNHCLFAKFRCDAQALIEDFPLSRYIACQIHNFLGPGPGGNRNPAS